MSKNERLCMKYGVNKKMNLLPVTCVCGRSWYPMESSIPSVNYGKPVSLSNVGVAVTSEWWRTQLRLHSNIIIEHGINELLGEHNTVSVE